MRILGMIRTLGVWSAAAAAAGCASTAVMEQELTKTNTQTVLAFEATVFNKHDVQEAFVHYVGSTFVQHDPRPREGKDAAEQAYTQLVTQTYPNSRLVVERTVAQGDLVATQGVWSQKAGEGPEIQVVDIYRVSEGRIVEHWDVIQEGISALAGIQGLL